MADAPLVEIARAVGLGAARTQQPVLALVPVLRRLVDQVPRELVDEQERAERREFVQTFAERAHVMEHARGDDGVELAVEGLELAPAKPRALGCVRVDAEHVVAGLGEQPHEPTLPAAADLEHAPRRPRQLL